MYSISISIKALRYKKYKNINNINNIKYNSNNNNNNNNIININTLIIFNNLYVMLQSHWSNQSGWMKICTKKKCLLVYFKHA